MHTRIVDLQCFLSVSSSTSTFDHSFGMFKMAIMEIHGDMWVQRSEQNHDDFRDGAVTRAVRALCKSPACSESTFSACARGISNSCTYTSQVNIEATKRNTSSLTIMSMSSRFKGGAEGSFARELGDFAGGLSKSPPALKASSILCFEYAKPSAYC